jgi:hypothetical protein
MKILKYNNYKLETFKRMKLNLPCLLLLTQFICIEIFAGDMNFTANKATTAPTIDGIGNETCWNEAPWHAIDELWLPYEGSIDSSDFWGRYKVTWTNEKLYLLVEINDNELSDDHTNPLVDYWQDDCLEIFLDEDHSGGIHQYNYNAFAYHISTIYDVVDLGTDHSTHLYNDHISVVRTAVGNYYTWELSMDIYTDAFIYNAAENEKSTLTHNKKMGLSIAYCDNDETSTRETFIGSVHTPTAEDRHWIDATDFGNLTLNDPNYTDISDVNSSNLMIYPNPASNYLVVKNDVYTSFSIFSYNGQILESGELDASGETKIDVQDLSKGIYIIKLTDNSNSTVIRKLVIE